MARIRTIKPEFFKHADLYDAEEASGLPLRLAFAGLWTLCDREGRFRWKPREMKTDIMPYDPTDFALVLEALCEHGFVVKYESGGKSYGYVPSFKDHQVVNTREAASKLPTPTGASTETHVQDTATHAHAHGEKEGKGKEQVTPLSPPSGESACDEKPKKARAKPKRPLPKDFPDKTAIDWAIESEGLTTAQAKAEADGFRDYWEGEGALKADWMATWRGRIRRAKESGRLNLPRGSPSQGNTDMEFIKNITRGPQA